MTSGVTNLISKIALVFDEEMKMQYTNKADIKRKIKLIDSNPAVRKKVLLKSEVCVLLKDLQEIWFKVLVCSVAKVLYCAL